MQVILLWFVLFNFYDMQIALVTLFMYLSMIYRSCCRIRSWYSSRGSEKTAWSWQNRYLRILWTLILSNVTTKKFLLTISWQHQAGKWWEYRKMFIRRFLVDPLPNSPIKQHKNCVADNKENYLINEVSGVKGLTSFLEFCFVMQQMTLSGKLNINIITYLL